MPHAKRRLQLHRDWVGLSWCYDCSWGCVVVIVDATGTTAFFDNLTVFDIDLDDLADLADLVKGERSLLKLNNSLKFYETFFH